MLICLKLEQAALKMPLGQRNEEHEELVALLESLSVQHDDGRTVLPDFYADANRELPHTARRALLGATFDAVLPVVMEDGAIRHHHPRNIVPTACKWTFANVTRSKLTFQSG